MNLSDTRIHELAKQGLVTPYNPDLVQPASLEVTLGGDHVVVWREGYVWQQIKKPLPYEIFPGEPVVLATTAETLKIPTDMTAQFAGKSSLGRMGISTHVTAGFIDPGFHGQITLELLNESPIPFRLEKGMKIGQITFQKVDGTVARPYGTAGNHYQNQKGPTVANENSLGRPQ